MRIRLKTGAARIYGFSIVEVLVATALAGILFAGFYASVSFGFRSMRSARENLRATQIMIEKLEAIRLCTWDQLLDTNYVPPTFINYYNPTDTNEMGTAYHGEVTFTNVPFTTAYADKMTNVIIHVHWTNGAMRFDRQMTTYVASNGLQRYIYGD